ncbi:MAG: helix-turn-helix transcriptional regulator [Clostridium sp.]
MSIKKARFQKNVTQSSLAKQLNISQNYLSELEANKYDIKLSILIKISDLLDVCICDLVECGCKKCKQKRLK